VQNLTGTDSHGESKFEFIEFALAAALKGKIDPERILNFMSREALVNWANKDSAPTREDCLFNPKCA
jgi:histidinol phosphatase-like PHP family hydrolase